MKLLGLLLFSLTGIYLAMTLFFSSALIGPLLVSLSFVIIVYIIVQLCRRSEFIKNFVLALLESLF